MKKSILFLALSLMFMGKSNAQYWGLNGNTLPGSYSPPFILGAINTPANYDIYFYANGNQYMDLQYNTGYLGIGTSFSPAHLLDINGGDMNVNTNTDGYMIGGQMVLWNEGNASDIYVGVNSGNSGGGANCTAIGYNTLTNNTAAANTAVGYYALYTNTGGGGGNTAVGAGALTANTTAQFNTAIGWGALTNNNGATANLNEAAGAYALQQNTTGRNNTANGSYALNSNTIGSNNTACGGGTMQHATCNYGTATGNGALYYATSDGLTADGYYALYANTSGIANVATGYQALSNNNTGNYNTANGYDALLNNTTGTLNTAIGVDALYNNIGYSGNTAVGDSALYYQTGASSFNSGNVAVGNSTIYNGTGNAYNAAVGEWALRHANGVNNCTAIGYGSLYSMVNGLNNTAAGYESMFSLTTGVENTAYGVKALYSAVHNGDNVAMGEYALYNNIANANTGIGTGALQNNTTGTSNTSVGAASLGGTTGSANTAIGIWAGLNNAGDYNTFLGDSAGFGSNSNGFNNDVFVGFQSGPPTAYMGSNTIYLGNASTYTIEAVSAMTINTWSDRRVKDSIKANVPGLAFINRLQPVTFHYNISKEDQLMGIKDSSNWPGKFDVEKITQSGFIAQAVDSAAQACGYNFSGVTRPQNANQPYTLGYTTFVVPLVKAVQELSAKNDTLHDSLRTIRSTLDSLRNTLQSIQTCLNQLCGSTGEQGVTGPQNGIRTGSSNTNPALNTQAITLSGSIGGTPLLYQNAPNPFSTGTTINYYLPQGTIGATIVFYDTYGNMLKTVQLSQTGNGTLNITPDNLSNGIYSYSLIVNGTIIDTKKMLLQK